ncbi:Cadherin domain-containing protein [Dactylococcopsis salina PCC 8305]|uniref:Cadherin domain-containing protein n=1 Tax=Dactylococcopsis salina (strain PCC 8305) TaxID=13035 RepID=K9YY10_DACS8|nr:Cadherin domain-containing protein [Dactylococcopsis salina PCC 8305]
MGTINASYSLIENNADQINGTNTNNITGQDPLLDPAGLQDNGGPTQTIALLAGSPAIDAGDNNSIPAGVDFDQRGTGFDRIFNNTVDIGALELLPFALEVNTETDENDGLEAGDGISLRDAIESIAPGGTITFADGINTITLDETLEELVIDKGLTIDGDFDDDGSPDVTVERASDATVDFRIFNIDDGDNANEVTVTLDGLTVSGGNVSGDGGGIFNDEDLTLTNSTVSGNSAQFGGGIDNRGTANVTNSTVSGNSAQFGGGIDNFGTANVTNSTVSGNSADDGGGIFNSGTANVTNSTVSGNSADDGGGIFNFGSTANVTNSTVSGNSASDNGGGIYNFGTATLSNSLISGNSAATSGNEVFNYSGSFFTGTINADANNLFGDDSRDNSQAFTNFTPGANDITATSDGTNPTALNSILDPAGLQDNGGPTQTIALLEGSPAIDAGDNDSIPTGVDFDQRGFDRILNGTVDIGAFELLLALEVNTETDENDGLEAGDGISLRDAIESIASGGTITFANGINTITLDEALGELVIDKGLTIDGDFDDNGSPDVTVQRASDATVDFRIFNIDDGDSANEVTVTLDGLTITGGVASGSFPNNRGGGIFNREDLTLTNSTVSGNSATNDGGGIFNDGTANVTNSTVSGNSATDDGGGIFNYNGIANVTNSTVSGNSATDDGGGIYNFGTANVNNSTVSGNSANYDGGGINNFGTANVTNSTISGNSAANNGGGIWNDDGGGDTVTLSNSIVADNLTNGAEGGDLYNDQGSTLGTINASYSLIENNADQINGTNTNNITGQDPLLDPAGLQDNGGPTQTIALLEDSPAIDAGDNDSIPTGVDFDQRGFDRIVNGTVDIGAFEVQPPTDLIVDTETDEADGSVTDGDVSLRDALAAIASGGTITFADGINTITLNQTLGELVIDKGLTIDGDFDDDGSPDVTVERASGATAEFRIFNIDDGDSANEVTVTLDGLTISGGTVSGDGGGIFNREDLTLINSTVSGNSATDDGGGMWNAGTANVNNSSVSGNSAADNGGGMWNAGTANVNNSSVSGNSATDRGGGIFNYNGTANVSNSTVSGNSANYDGGGIWNNGSGTANVTNSTVSGNSATDDGGGISNSGTATLSNSTVSGNSAADNGGGIFNLGTANVNNSSVSGNSATDHGGGIFNYNGTANVSNSTVSGNSADGHGGGIDNFGTANVSNSTVSGNSAADNGGGIWNDDGGDDTVTLSNSIVADNLTNGAEGGDLYNEQGSTLGTINASYSLIENNADQINGTNTNNITGQDPLLDPAGLQDNGGPTQTIALLVDSPAIDAGDNNLIPDGVSFDQRGDGFDRIFNGTVDIGAFEVEILNTAPTVDDLTTSVPENSTAVTTITANDPENDPLTFSISGGVDSNFFAIDANTGELSFSSAPDFENPADDGSDNVYEVEVTVSDGSLTDTATVTVTINGVNDAPNISEIPDQTFDQDSSSGAIDFTISDVETAADSLTVSATSDNQTLMPDGNITLSGTDENRTLELTSVSNELGTANITVTVDDGTDATTETFILTVNLTHLVVDTLIDEVDGSVTDGDISLRDALSAIAPGGTITFANGINTITLDQTLGELVIDKGLTIDGDFDDDGSPDVTVQRASDATVDFRIFNIDDGDNANEVTVTLDGLTVSGGGLTFSSGTVSGDGGGIYNREDLTLTNSTVSDNSALDGGGIFNDGTANVTNSTVSGNSAAFDGGGIFNDGTANVTNSTVSGNFADDGGGIWNDGTANVTNSTVSGNFADDGGGIYNLGGGIYNLGTANVTNSTVSGNFADDGGGIWNDGTANVTNSTVSGNFADDGGGIYNLGTANVSNSTLSGNSATNGGGIFNLFATANVTNSTVSGNFADDGGGIYNLGTANVSNSTLSGNSATDDGGGIYNNFGTATLSNSLISGNSAATSGNEVFNYSEGFITGTINADANNLFGDDSRDNSQAFTNFTPGANDITATSDGTNPTALNSILDPAGLQDNGGPTQTIALLEGSPAIDAGDNNLIPASVDFDQRGFDRIFNGTVDIGAFEVEILNTAPTVDDITTSVPENSTAVTTITANDPENDPLTFSISGGVDGNFFAIDANTGELSFVSAPDLENPADDGSDNVYEVEVTVSDGSLTDTATVSVTVTDVVENLPPTVNDDNFSTDEDTVTSGNVLTNDSDPDSDPLTIVEVNGNSSDVGNQITLASGALLTLNSDGTFDYNPNGKDEALGDSETATDSLTYTVSDGNGETDTATVTVTINGVNDAPNISAVPAQSLPENSTAVTTISANDPENDPLTFSISGGVDGNFFAIDANTGELSFVSAPDFENPQDADGNNVYQVQVTANDGNGGTDVANVEITINDIANDIVENQPPVVNVGNFEVSELARNGTEIGQLDISDPDGDDLTVSLSEASQVRLINTFTEGTTEDPDVDGDGNAPFAIDNEGVITVNDTDDLGPLFKVVSLAFTRTVPSFSLMVEVSDGEAINIGAAIIDVNCGRPASGFGDPHVTTFDRNNFGFQVVGEFTLVESTDENNPLIIQARTAPAIQDDGTPSDQLSSYTAIATDFGGDTVAIYAREENPVVINGETVTDIPVDGIEVGDSGRITDLGDGFLNINLGGEAQERIVVQFLENRIDPRFFLSEERNGNITGVMGNKDGDPSNDIVDSNGDVIEEATFEQINGEFADAFRVTEATNSLLLREGEDINEINDPDFAAEEVTLASLEADLGTEAFNDIVAQVEAAGVPEGFLRTSAIIDFATTGDDSFIDSALNVAGGNATPEVDDAVFNIEEDLVNGEVVGTVSIQDGDDGDNLEVSISAGNDDIDGDENLPFAIDGQGQITINDSGDLVEAGEGTAFSLSVTATDPLGATGTGSVTIVENNPDVDQPPTVAANVNEIRENSPEGTIVGRAIATDAEGDEFTLGLEGDLDPNGNGTDAFTIAENGLITVADPGDLDFETTPSFEFDVTATQTNDDTIIGTSTVTVSLIDVEPEDNSPPEITSDSALSIEENNTFVDTVTANDPEGDFLTFSLTGGVDQGLFTLDVEGNLNFIEAPDFENPIDADEDNIYELEITAEDENGGNTSQTLNIEVLDVSEDTNESPIITSDSLQTIEENTIAPLSLQADDPDGDEVTFSLTGGADQGLFTINPDTGELEFNNPPDFENPIDADEDNIYELEVTAEDGNGGIITENFQIEVTDVDETIDWSLDIDGNGEISPLSDGIMTVRFLFGDAFSNDDLINGAIGAEASRSLPEIRDHLQIGVDEGFLDIDEDGEINPLSDGIIAVRFLFGDAFAGEALINGAISPDSSLSLEEIQANLADLTSI